MSAGAAFADPNPARTELRVATLHQWARAALDMADRVADAAGRDIVEVVRLIFRLTQTVRLAIALATRLSDPTFQPTPAKPRAVRATQPETRVESEPVETPERERPESERPRRDHHERPRDREVSDAAILRRPMKDIIKFICRNLGVVPDWSLWTDDDATPTAAEPALERPRPKPIPPTPRLRDPYPALGRRLIWISPSEQAPAPARLRTQLRSTASPLALDPIAPSERSISHAHRR
jgi:hypothetical protein